MKFGSVCSGIEAASVALHPLGWSASWFAEIEAFPSAVLAYRFPSVPNLGDMTTIAERVRSGEVEAPDALIGGTPCQSFSVAGLRAGLSDARGQLTYSYVELANAIDSIRTIRGERPAVIWWENVPGVLSSKDNAFGCFLAGLAGESSELQPAGGKWTDAGCVFGPQRAVAWRVLDAQYIGLAQRRRRVFVVASADPDFDPVSVLFEFDGVRRDSPPSREPGQGFAADVAPSLVSSGRGVERIGETRGQDQVVAVDIRNGALAHDGPTMSLQAGGISEGRGMCINALPCVMCMAHGQGGAEIASERRTTLTCNHEAPIAFLPGEAAFSTSGAGTGRGQPIVAAFAENSRAELRYEAGDGGVTGALKVGGGKPGQSYPVAQIGMAVRRLLPIECERLQGFPDNWTRIPIKQYAKRTITKLRSEDMWEKIDGAWWLMAADGPRYKALGNSMATNVMRWIGARITAALAAHQEPP